MVLFDIAIGQGEKLVATMDLVWQRGVIQGLAHLTENLDDSRHPGLHNEEIASSGSSALQQTNEGLQQTCDHGDPCVSSQARFRY